jgi:hypothetical protein
VLFIFIALCSIEKGCRFFFINSKIMKGVVSIKPNVNRRMTMKKNIWLAAGIAGMLFANCPVVAQAEVDVRIGIGDRGRGDRHRGGLDFVIDSRPDFIYLPDRGFHVSVRSPHDVIYYGNRYYLYRNGSWYLSRNYRGPWILVMDYDLPYRLRRHRTDIWRYRDMEYRRHDRRYWDERRRHDDRGPRDDRGDGRDGRW